MCRGLIWVVLLGLGFSVALPAQDDDTAEPVRAVTKLMVQAVEEAIKEVLLVEYLIVVDEQKSFFDLGDQEVRTLQLLAEKLSVKQMETQNNVRVEQAVNQVLKSFASGSTFVVNGKEYTVEGEERIEPMVEVSVALFDRFLRMNADVPSRRLRMSIFNQGEFLHETDADWKNCVEGAGKRTLRDYEDHVEQRFTDSVADMMLALVIDALAISPEQKSPIREWLINHVKLASGKTIYDNAKEGLLEIKELPQDVLTQAQRESWRLLIGELGAGR